MKDFKVGDIGDLANVEGSLKRVVFLGAFEPIGVTGDVLSHNIENKKEI